MEGEGIVGRIWNSTFARYIVPDLINVNFNLTGVVGVGRGYNLSINLITRGKNAGFHGLETTSKRVGLHFDASMNMSAGWYNGNPRNASLESLLGRGLDTSADVEAFGAGLWSSLRDNGTPSWLGYDFGMGPGVGISAGITNTTIK
nr:hypothetical protein [Pedobacter panaciterrae]